MSNDRSLGIDMTPEPIPDFAVVEERKPVPATEAERNEYVNADVLRRACHVRMDALVRRVRGLSVGAPIDIKSIVAEVATDLEESVRRYLEVERTFRSVR